MSSTANTSRSRSVGKMADGTWSPGPIPEREDEGVGRDEGTGFEAEELLMRAGALFLSVRSVGDIKDDGVNGLWGVRGKAGPTPAAPAPAADVLFWLGSIAAPLGVDGGGYAGGRDIIGLSAAGRTAAVFPAIMTPGS